MPDYSSHFTRKWVERVGGTTYSLFGKPDPGALLTLFQQLFGGRWPDFDYNEQGAWQMEILGTIHKRQTIVILLFELEMDMLSRYQSVMLPTTPTGDKNCGNTDRALAARGLTTVLLTAEQIVQPKPVLRESLQVLRGLIQLEGMR